MNTSKETLPRKSFEPQMLSTNTNADATVTSSLGIQGRADVGNDHASTTANPSRSQVSQAGSVFNRNALACDRNNGDLGSMNLGKLDPTMALRLLLQPPCFTNGFSNTNLLAFGCSYNVPFGTSFSNLLLGGFGQVPGALQPFLTPGLQNHLGPSVGGSPFPLSALINSQGHLSPMTHKGQYISVAQASNASLANNDADTDKKEIKVRTNAAALGNNKSEGIKEREPEDEVNPDGPKLKVKRRAPLDPSLNSKAAKKSTSLAQEIESKNSVTSRKLRSSRKISSTEYNDDSSEINTSDEDVKKKSKKKRKSICHFCTEAGKDTCGLFANKCPNRLCNDCGKRHRYKRCKKADLGSASA